MKAISLAVAALVALSGCASNQPKASPGALSFKVTGMACANCAKEIEHELTEVPGVKTAKVDFKKSMATVTLDPAKPATQEQLDAAVSHWRTEHFGAKEDAKCLDPQRREEIKRGG
jgi:copper chaperone CopZ